MKVQIPKQPRDLLQPRSLASHTRATVLAHIMFLLDTIHDQIAHRHTVFA
jgi:hypothetical protein